MNSVLVTGATGNVGRSVADGLRARRIPVATATHDPDGAHPGTGDGNCVVHLDFLDPQTWRAALDGSDRIFLMRPPAISRVDESINPFVDEACRQGVEHIVFLSVAGAEKNPLVPHHRIEKHLQSVGASHTILRPGFFAQNIGSAYRQDIVERDRIFVPAGSRKPVNWIDTRDIGDVAALVLADPGAFPDKAYTLTGPGPVHWSHVADVLSEVLGRRIDYEPASIPAYVRHLWRRQLPAGAIAVQTVLHALLRTGQGELVDPALAQLLGRAPRTLDDYIHDHAELWRPPGEQLPA